jgi:hypothetical protein
METSQVSASAKAYGLDALGSLLAWISGLSSVVERSPLIICAMRSATGCRGATADIPSRTAIVRKEYDVVELAMWPRGALALKGKVAEVSGGRPAQRGCGFAEPATAFAICCNDHQDSGIVY